MKRFLRIICMAVTLGILGSSVPALGQQPAKLRMPNLAFPSAVSTLLAIIKDKGFDRKHAIEMEVTTYGAVSAYYASVATGESDGVFAGPLVAQRMRLEGVPLKIASTLVDMATISVITKNPSIRSITDLKGKTIAADMASAEYSVLSLYAKRKGLILGKDVTVVQASPALVRTQLAADRVDAGMSWEPTATLTIRDSSAYHFIFNGREGWRELTGKDGWDLIFGVREDWLARNAAALPRVIAVLDEAARFMHSNLDESDLIVQRALKMPPGALKEMIAASRLIYQVHATMTDAAARQSLWEFISLAVGEGYFKQPVRDQSVILAP